MPNTTKSAIVSIHDVMPHTLKETQKLIDLCQNVDPNHLYLLIVPGLNWQSSHINQLREWQSQGIRLAGHGWHHHTKHIKGLYHKLHSFFISRNVAEHLSLSSHQLENLIRKNFKWFRDNKLAAPNLYVPPAWAMGKLSRQQLKSLPFRYYEVSNGIYDSDQDRFLTLPLTGYEADCWWRKPIIAVWNIINLRLASSSRPVRISLHPFDLSYKLSHQLRAQFRQPFPTQTCEILFKSK